ncbi:hypothetical protein Gohar_013782 [Gossypium harknessii]|uniref:RNase H type-1 domain-containing protein n=1 Tax=Gossypium harknessii TaxID=34285 RepID=A0A7J9H1V7_9ROSI|nr:hypothetical protein [Gossypium harknessii]
MFVNGERSWICLNSNGVVKLDFELVVFGGVLKDRHGVWILGFNKSLGHYSVFNAKLWGVLDGLRILQSQNYNGVVIRVDSQEALQAIQILKNIFFRAYQAYSAALVEYQSMEA